jgi:hypothetical protein
MSVTINVNGLSLCHKGSGGYVKNTVPDACLTPGKCIPKPYSIVSYSKDLVKGTTTVKADGGNMCANLGSEFSCCTGDGGGSCGGVVSGTTEAESTWITYSPDVFMEGKAVCRLTDKMWMNHGNSVSMGGDIQESLGTELFEELCEMMCECRYKALRQQCVADKIKEKYYDGDYPKDFDNGLLREVSMENGNIIPNSTGTGPTSNPITPGGGIRPDILVRSREQTTKIIEMKFEGDTLNTNQQQIPESKYSQAADNQGADYEVLEEDDCTPFCDGGGGRAPVTVPAPVPVPVPASEPSKGINWWLVGGLGVATVAAALFPFDGPVGDAFLGAAFVAALSPQ